MHYFSKSSHEIDNVCRRRRWWHSFAGGTGYTPNDEAIELNFGQAVHTATAALVQKAHPDQARTAMWEVWQPSDPALVWLAEGLVYAWQTIQLPRYFAEWDVIAVEKQLVYHQGGIGLMSIPDIVLRHKKFGRVRYLELKTTKTLSPAYLESWHYSVQLWSGPIAVEQTLGIAVDEVVVGFFFKGEKRSTIEEHYIASPFTSIFISEAGEYAQKRPKTWKGWTRVNTWEHFQSPAQLYAKLDLNTLAAQVPETQPLFFDAARVETWKRQAWAREMEVKLTLDIIGMRPEVTKEALDITFPQNFAACRPAYGNACPFVDLCWNDARARDPEAGGLYTKRVSRYPKEVEEK